MKVYVSGKITGDDDYRAKFARAARRLRTEGHDAVNPCSIGEHAEFSYDDYLHVDFAIIDVCDAVYMLRDWQQSPGARKELQYASDWKKKILYEDDSTREEGFPIRSR